MTPTEVKVIKASLGLSSAKLELALGLKSKGRTIRRWMSGEQKVSGMGETLLRVYWRHGTNI